jgi:hypothetical protein
MPRPLYPQGYSPWYPLDRRLGGPQSRFGRGGEEKNSQPLPEKRANYIKCKNPEKVQKFVLYNYSALYHIFDEILRNYFKRLIFCLHFSIGLRGI